MTTRKTREDHLTAVALVVGLGIALLGAGGCGGAKEASPAPGVPDETQVSAATSGSITVPGDGPVDTTILIDRTAIAGDSAFATEYTQAAERMLKPTIDRGGVLRILAFGSVAGHAKDIYTVELPKLEDLGPASRDDAGQTAAAQHALQVAVGLADPPTDSDVKDLAALTRGSGTDQARMIRDALGEMKGSSADAQNVYLASDGLIDQPEFVLARVLAADDGKAAGQRITDSIELPDDFRRVSLLRIGGLGITAGRSVRDAAELDELRVAWETACSPLAQVCEIDSQP